MNKLIDNFYFSECLYVVFIIFIGIATIRDMDKKFDIRLKDELDLKRVDISFLMRVTLFALFIKIFIEQLMLYIPMKHMTTAIPDDVLSIILICVVSCTFVPFFEEIIFRFGLYKYLKIKMNYKKAAIITSMIFALIHFYTIDGTISLIISALLYNYSYYKKDNLLYPIIVHFFVNLYAITAFLNLNDVYYILFGAICFTFWLILILKEKAVKTTAN